VPNDLGGWCGRRVCIRYMGVCWSNFCQLSVASQYGSQVHRPLCRVDYLYISFKYWGRCRAQSFVLVRAEEEAIYKGA
jgi:hypothetical protein